MKTLALHGSITLLIVALALLLYDRWVVRPALAIGMVDVGYVYRVKEAEFTQLLTKSASDEDRQRAMDMARRFFAAPARSPGRAAPGMPLPGGRQKRHGRPAWAGL